MSELSKLDEVPKRLSLKDKISNENFEWCISRREICVPRREVLEFRCRQVQRQSDKSLSDSK